MKNEVGASLLPAGGEGTTGKLRKPLKHRIPACAGMTAKKT